jgi:aminopeptidase-like protein
VTSPYGPQPDAGSAMHALIADLFPICRSITGEGLRRTLRVLRRFVPLELHEVASGTAVLDWTVPKEWNIRDAWVADAAGRRVIDFRAHTLHVVSYSVPVRRRMPLAELRPHLHTLPEHPDWIPYRTSYYAETWGFCLAHRTLETMPDGEYEVCIDATLEPGHLTYGELFLPGTTADEILFSCHCCHPSLANDNLAGLAVAVWLAQALAGVERRHGMRFLFIPATIGSLTWLASNPEAVGRIRHGLVLSCLGDGGRSTYKRSRRGTALVDRAATHVLRCAGPHEVLDFVPYGYDERQYCSPGFDLPVGLLTRTPNGRFPEYHTSADDLTFVRPEALDDSLAKVLRIVEVLEHDATYLNLSPRGEPQLGRRGLYGSTGGKTPPGFEMALLWVLNLSDGRHTLLDIAERAETPFRTIRQAALALEAHGLLRQVPPMEYSMHSPAPAPPKGPPYRHEPEDEARSHGPVAEA